MERTLAKTNELVKKTQEQVEATNRSADAALANAAAAHESAKAAAQSVVVARTLLESSEGAMVVADIRMPQTLRQGQNRFPITLKNIGKGIAGSPTLLLAGTAKQAVGVPPDWGHIDEAAYRSGQMRPGEVVDWGTLVIDLSEDDLVAINKPDNEGRVLVYAFVVARYWNGFSCKRTHICVTYLPERVAAAALVELPTNYVPCSSGCESILIRGMTMTTRSATTK